MEYWLLAMLALIMIWLISQCHPCSIFQMYLSGHLEMNLGIQSMSVLWEYLADLFCKMEFLFRVIDFWSNHAKHIFCHLKI